MGQFSWIYSDTDKQLVDNKKADDSGNHRTN